MFRTPTCRVRTRCLAPQVSSPATAGAARIRNTVDTSTLSLFSKKHSTRQTCAHKSMFISRPLREIRNLFVRFMYSPLHVRSSPMSRSGWALYRVVTPPPRLSLRQSRPRRTLAPLRGASLNRHATPPRLRRHAVLLSRHTPPPQAATHLIPYLAHWPRPRRITLARATGCTIEGLVHRGGRAP